MRAPKRLLRLPPGPAPAAWRQAAEAARAGLVVAFPTDTVYGLGSSARSREAAKRIFALKGRPKGKPLPLLAASLEDAARWVVLTPAAEALARRFWPGPLTLVLKATPAGAELVCAAGGTIAVRVPAHPELREAISLSGSPWCATSANLSDSPALTDGAAVAEAFEGKADLVLAGGRLPGTESTVADASGKTVRVLREGAVPSRELLEAAGQAA